MGLRTHIPREVLIANPKFNITEIRIIVNTMLKAKSARLRHANIFDIRLPKIGRIRSRANKKDKGLKRIQSKDRKRKEAQLIAKRFSKENLLW